MCVLSSPATITGTSLTDYILGVPAAGLDSTLNGGAGNDHIFGDFTPFLIASQVSGATHAAAFNMTAAGGLSLWSVQENPFITNSTVDPHASAVIEATGSYQWFRFDVTAGQKLTVDIDHAFGGLSSSFDARVSLFGSDGATLILSDDNQAVVDAGSTSTRDSFLTWTAATAGTYYVRICTAAGAAIPSGNSYVANFSLTGQAYDTVNGGSGNDVLNGGAGVDSLFGGAGDDTFRFVGSDLGDNINGDSGNDTLDLSGRSDSLAFTIDLRLGSAQFTANPYGDDGVYRVRSVEHVIGTEYADSITGTDQGNRLLGGSGNDTLSGGDGADTLNGGTGNDRFFVDSAMDVIVETSSGGTGDTVNTSVSYTLSAGAHVEILQTTDVAGTSAIFLTGNELSQHIIGNAGNNQLASSIGDADRLSGKGGDDTYWLSNAGDMVKETVGGGTDTVRAAVSYKLANAAKVEILATNDVDGTSSIDLTGNKYAQALVGNAGANRLNGGLGADTMTGGDGADVFVFSTSARNGNVDTITDFIHGTDTIELENAVFSRLAAGPLAATAFETVTDSTATEATIRIMYDSDSGDLLFDIDGTGANTAIVVAHLTAGLTLTADDFMIV